jgi:deazaflavin-dependent oxidoreductase (nitroreductase family)
MITDTLRQDDASPRLGRRVAHFNRLVTNRVAKLVAPWLPGFGVVAHLGRASHRSYRTPVNVFRVDDGYVIALTYGKQSDWVQNVLAAGGCELTTHGRSVKLQAPRIVHDESRALVSSFVRPFLRFMRVADFLHLELAP